MIVLSIDVGIRNLAYIIIKIEDMNKHSILKWDVLELIETNEKVSNANNTKIGESLYLQFDEVLTTQPTIDKILIENQIGQNAIKMKCIQGMINMYFVMRNYNIENIINYNAKNKLKMFMDNKKTTYNERKKKSKEVTKQLCEKYYGDTVHSYYCKYKKKDDLADCLLQALDYMKCKDFLNESFYKVINDNELS